MVRPIQADGFGTFTRDALPDQIAARVIRLITERRLEPGDRLPPERELAQSMGVSRSSLREALRALSLLGVTEMRQGDGTYLTALDPEALMRPFGLVLALGDGQMKELFEARRVIEPGLAALAAERIDDQTLDELRRCVRDSAAAVGDEEAFMRADLELHGLIAKAASNSILWHVIGSVSGMGVASRRRTTGMPGVQQQTVEDHRAIVAALEARDAAAAAAAMLHHLENVERRSPISVD
jgi:GntR family transcriptional regulator, transcriptional repressor for pyruvate dehydrogenase complex